jgi:hypothetical protein
MSVLFIATAILEAVAGLGALVVPAAAAPMLLGETVDGPAALVLVRVAGVALLALAMACWAARHDQGTPAARGVVRAMTVYNVGVIGILASAALGTGLAGRGLWPTVAVHAVMAIWCVRVASASRR